MVYKLYCTLELLGVKGELLKILMPRPNPIPIKQNRHQNFLKLPGHSNLWSRLGTSSLHDIFIGSCPHPRGPFTTYTVSSDKNIYPGFLYSFTLLKFHLLLKIFLILSPYTELLKLQFLWNTVHNCTFIYTMVFFFPFQNYIYNHPNI